MAAARCLYSQRLLVVTSVVRRRDFQFIGNIGAGPPLPERPGSGGNRIPQTHDTQTNRSTDSRSVRQSAANKKKKKTAIWRVGLKKKKILKFLLRTICLKNKMAPLIQIVCKSFIFWGGEEDGKVRDVVASSRVASLKPSIGVTSGVWRWPFYLAAGKRFNWIKVNVNPFDGWKCLCKWGWTCWGFFESLRRDLMIKFFS